MNEWEVKYKALAAGISDQRLIVNAETLVRAATQLSATTAQPFDAVFYAMMEAIRLQQGRTNPARR